MNQLEKGEVWKQSFLYIEPKFWRSDQLNGKEYEIEIQGVGSDGSDLDDVYLPLCVGCPSHEDGCFWECVSSHYAYRIQMYDGTVNNYRLEMAGELDTDGVFVPHYEWFSVSEFNDFIDPFLSGGNPAFRNMVDFDLEDQLNEPPYRMVHYEENELEGFYRNGYGEIIEGDVYGIQKGLGPWYADNSETIGGVTVDYCDLPGVGEVDFATIVDYFNDESDVSTDLECAADLGDTGYIYPDETGDGSYKNWLTFQPSVKYKPDPDDGDDDGGGDGIVVDDENWPEYVSDVFNFTMDDFDDPDMRYSEMLMNCQLFKVARLGNDGYESIFSGSTSDFVQPDGTPNMPIINFETGLHSVALKRSGFPIMYGVFEVRAPFAATLPLKDFFTPNIYPNPITEDFFFIDIETTAQLRVHYEILDSNGDQLYRYDFRLPKDHEGTHKIIPDVSLPSGFLYHRFSFTDGSYETLTTINN